MQKMISMYIDQLRMRITHCSQCLVLTDGEDPRVIAAARHLLNISKLQLILVGQTSAILPQARRLGIADALEIYDPQSDPRQANLTHLLQARLEKRGRPLPDSATLVRMAQDPVYCGALLVKTGLADGMVGGAVVPTARVIRAGLQVIGVDQDNPVVSGAFIMLLATPLPAGQQALVFADSAVIPLPTVDQLVSIALNTAGITRTILGQEPIVALLSFSTYGSAEDPSAARMREALYLLRKHAPDFRVDGEMQLDAALIPEISTHKAPGNLVRGQANVLIFPNLDAGNIAYKLVERIGHATALGVILSGLARPINDLSRGCNVDDVVNMAAITALQSLPTPQTPNLIGVL